MAKSRKKCDASAKGREIRGFGISLTIAAAMTVWGKVSIMKSIAKAFTISQIVGIIS